MHPILAQRRYLGLYLAAWLPVAGLISVLLVYSGRLSWPEALALAVPAVALDAFLCLAAWYLCRAFPLQKTGILRLFFIYAAAALLTSSLWVFIMRGVAAALSSAPLFAGLSERWGDQVPLLYGVGILLFWLVAAVHYLLSSFEGARQAEGRALRTQILAREAELKALRAQIDPHFLFNCLNSISALTAADPALARQMCLLLADFLRMSLSLGNREFITLEEEIGLAGQFLAIEQVRLGPRLTVERSIQETARPCLVPPLILQPLVENSVRHGIAQLISGGLLRIEAERRGERLRVAIENPLDPEAAPADGKGIGLKNVLGRLRSQFGADARMEVKKSNNVFRVEISLPARTEDLTAGRT
jgi:two-component system sensor histidine kinase AlgZ